MSSIRRTYIGTFVRQLGRGAAARCGTTGIIRAVEGMTCENERGMILLYDLHLFPIPRNVNLQDQSCQYNILPKSVHDGLDEQTQANPELAQ